MGCAPFSIPLIIGCEFDLSDGDFVRFSDNFQI
ncbi:hypothetical protein IX306_000214 [Porphyromonas levii]|nr:hypothetical protein [Porphyromonas levii]MBR8805853.1 hypothetical protein [Porphyromonas levii]